MRKRCGLGLGLRTFAELRALGANGADQSDRLPGSKELVAGRTERNPAASTVPEVLLAFLGVTAALIGFPDLGAVHGFPHDTRLMSNVLRPPSKARAIVSGLLGCSALGGSGLARPVRNSICSTSQA